MNNTDSTKEFFTGAFLPTGGSEVSLGLFVTVAGLFFFILLGFMAYMQIRSARSRMMAETAARDRAHEAEQRMAELVANQNELTGRMSSMADIFSNRLDDMSGRVGQSISETSKSTQESLARLQERLAVIDSAQTNIAGLAGQVVELQNILSNKQTRGAFGEGRMQQIVQDGLPIGSYEFQATLSNGARPDCIIHMPNDTPPLVIDAKFPLESWHRIRKAESSEQSKIAAQAFRRDVEIHIKAISEKYLIKSETQDTAFMFVPSESIFAEIHENFESLVQKAHRARVIIVSPSLLMLSIQVMQSVLKDVHMREQAHLIQREIVLLMQDVGRLDDRVRKLDTHFGQARKDVEQILTSTDKVTKRGTRITELEFEENTQNAGNKKPGLEAVK